MSGGSGYVSFHGKEFVSDEDAFDYALDKVMNDEEEKKEFVEWFFSGNWVRKEEG